VAETNIAVQLRTCSKTRTTRKTAYRYIITTCQGVPAQKLAVIVPVKEIISNCRWHTWWLYARDKQVREALMFCFS